MNVREEYTIKGLECCAKAAGCKSCAECPYKMIRYPKCREELMRDSRDFMRQLKDAVDQFEMVAPSPGAVEDMARENTELLEKIEQLEQERDAALYDMHNLQGAICAYCKNLRRPIGDKHCECQIFGSLSDVLEGDERSPLMCGSFEWRGVCDENKGDEGHGRKTWR